MRRILVDHAREQSARKRAGEFDKLPISAAFGIPAEDQALLHSIKLWSVLQMLNPRQAQVVDLRFLVGLTGDETAAILGVRRKQ